MLAVARERDPAHSVGRIWLLSPCVDFLYGANPAPGDAHALAWRQHGRDAGEGLAVAQANSASPRLYQRCTTLVRCVFHDD